MRLILLGPPGSGKGTQGKFLQDKYGACGVSTGEILRGAVNEQTPLGEKAARYLRRGDLVPDSVMVDLVGERLRAKDCEKGFILDGFPRTIGQADGLQALLKDRDLKLDSVLYIRVAAPVVTQRLTGRRTCKRCGALFHTVFNPPAREGVCDRCGGELYQREDDREETIAARLLVYETQTAPLIDYYRKRGLLREVDGEGTVEEIRARVFAALKKASG